MEARRNRLAKNIHTVKEIKQSSKDSMSVEQAVRSYNLDLSTPLDLKGWMQTFATEELYFKLLPSFEDNGFMENLYYIAYWVQVGNFYLMKERGHAIKGSAAYAGASRISNDCYWIQVYFEKREYANMMKHYLDLLEHSAQFRIYWRKVYFKYLKKPYDYNPEHAWIPVPAGYSLTKIGEYEFKVSYPEDYLELALEAENRGKKYIIITPGVTYNVIYTNQEEEKENDPTIENNLMITAEGECKPIDRESVRSEERKSVYQSFSKSSLDLKDLCLKNKDLNKTQEIWLIAPQRKSKLSQMASFKSYK